MGLNILGRVGIHISFLIMEKKFFLYILKGISPFKMHEI